MTFCHSINQLFPAVWVRVFHMKQFLLLQHVADSGGTAVWNVQTEVDGFNIVTGTGVFVRFSVTSLNQPIASIPSTWGPSPVYDALWEWQNSHRAKGQLWQHSQNYSYVKYSTKCRTLGWRVMTDRSVRSRCLDRRPGFDSERRHTEGSRERHLVQLPTGFWISSERITLTSMNHIAWRYAKKFIPLKLEYVKLLRATMHETVNSLPASSMSTVDFRQEAALFLFTATGKLSLGTTHTIQWITLRTGRGGGGGLSAEVKRQEHETNLSLQYGAEVKNARSYIYNQH